MSDWHSPLLPPNQTRLEAAIARAPDIEARVTADIIATLWDAQRCPARLLPWLAWALSVDDWDEAWDDTTKRRMIAASIEIHRRKGTPWAVRRALELLGLHVQIREWFNTGNAPYTFEVRIAAAGRIDRQAVARAIDAYKPVSRSHGITAVITAGSPGGPGDGGAGGDSGGTGGNPGDPDAQNTWPKTKLIHPRAAAGIGIVQVRQQTRRVPLVMKRTGAGVGVVRIRQAARPAQIIQPRSGGGIGIIRLGTLPPDSWQTWARPLGDVDAFRRGLLHGWTTRTPRTWRDGNFDSYAFVALLRSKFGV